MNVGCKEMLLWKLIYAVMCSVMSQVLFLIVFLFAMNFSILQPFVWVQLTIKTVTSFQTWLYLIPLSVIIFAQGVICSKEYVYENVYKTTRFLKFISFFSLRNLVMITLHILTGGLIVWLYLALLGGKYGSTYKIIENRRVLVEESFFMLMNGFWIGLYYFIKTYYVNERSIIFPIIQQRKFLVIKSNIFSKLYQAGHEAIWPTIYFIVIYYYKGVKLREWIRTNLNLSLEKESINLFDFVNSPLLIYSWLFSLLFIFTILCMRLYFEVFLTEQWTFPIESEFSHILTLKEGIAMNHYPIVQHQACLDLLKLSTWDPVRRQQLFTLSQPGGHPHNWNALLNEVLKLINDFSSDLNKAVDAILLPLIPNLTKVDKVEKDATSFEKQEPLFKSYSSPIRNMALPKEEPAVDIIQVTYNQVLMDVKNFIKSITVDKLKNLVGIIKKRSGYQYLFGDVPESRIYFLLSKGQPVIWAVQGLSFLSTASFSEDKYGVVQKDLVVIITNLILLKQNLDKLNKVSFVNRKSMQGEPIRMQLKTALRTAVRRSLYNIGNTFGEYVGQIPLTKEVNQQMQAFVSYREG